MEENIILGALMQIAGKDVIGVFDHADLTVEELSSYYGEYVELEYHQIEDSGIEWIMKIITNGDELTLMLCSYIVNDI